MNFVSIQTNPPSNKGVVLLTLPQPMLSLSGEPALRAIFNHLSLGCFLQHSSFPSCMSKDEELA